LAYVPFFYSEPGRISADTKAYLYLDPGHLLATLAAAGGDPARALMVGDHHNDVAAAHGAGMPCIFAAWGYGAPDTGHAAAATARHFADIAALAEDLLPA
jgi:phosphoglycolate phosphatase